MPIPVQCSHCDSILKLKDEASDSLGRHLRCPECGESFLAKRYPPRDEEPAGDDFEFDAEEEDGVELARRRRSRPASKAGGQRGRSGTASNHANKDSGIWKKGLSIGGGALVILLIVGRAFLRFQNALPPAGQPVAPTVQSEGGIVADQIPTDEECLAFARQLEADVKLRKGQALTAINWNRIVDRSIEGLDLSPGFIRGYKQGATGAIPGSFTNQITQSLGASGSYRFLRVHTVGSEKRILFRLLLEAGGVNYHDFEVVKNVDGRLELADLYVFITAEKMSETLRQLAIQNAMSQKGSFLGRLTGQLSDFEAHAQTIQTMNAQRNTQQFAAALATFRRLPTSIQQQKAFLLIRVMIAGQVNDQEYMTAMDEFRRLFPGDTCVDFMSIDFFTLRKEFDKTLTAIDRVDQSLGGDPYLNILRANALTAQMNFPEARRVLELAMQADPDAVEPLSTLVDVALAQHDFDAVLMALKRLQDEHQYQFDNLSAVAEFAEFVKSPQYQEWLRQSQ